MAEIRRGYFDLPWRYWVLLPVFTFLALVLAIVALSMQGSAYVLLVGSIVCAAQAYEMFREVRRRVSRAG